MHFDRQTWKELKGAILQLLATNAPKNEIHDYNIRGVAIK
jgi:hypothetical protein